MHSPEVIPIPGGGPERAAVAKSDAAEAAMHHHLADVASRITKMLAFQHPLTRPLPKCVLVHLPAVKQTKYNHCIHLLMHTVFSL